MLLPSLPHLRVLDDLLHTIVKLVGPRRSANGERHRLTNIEIQIYDRITNDLLAQLKSFIVKYRLVWPRNTPNGALKRAIHCLHELIAETHVTSP
jgi:hypothetical protein